MQGERLKRLKMDKNLTQDDITKLIKQAGFRSKASFARHFGLNPDSVAQWGKQRNYPAWFLPCLELVKRLRKYEEL